MVEQGVQPCMKAISKSVILSEARGSLRSERESKDPENVSAWIAASGFLTRNPTLPNLRVSLSPWAKHRSHDGTEMLTADC